jgi:hypothetical protein
MQNHQQGMVQQPSCPTHRLEGTPSPNKKMDGCTLGAMHTKMLDRIGLRVAL